MLQTPTREARKRTVIMKPKDERKKIKIAEIKKTQKKEKKKENQ